jgi:hypothetical protein
LELFGAALETIELSFDVKHVSLVCMQGAQPVGHDWLNLLLTPKSGQALINELGGQITIGYAVLQVYKASDDLNDVDHGTVGELKYDGDMDECCSGQIRLSDALFDRLIQSLVNGQRDVNVILQVQGLKRTADGLVWLKRDTIALPVTSTLIATDLFGSVNLA